MPREEHTAAAELHERAARSQRTVADQYDNDRDMADRESAETYGHAVRAYAASKHAHEESTHHKKYA